MIAGGPQTARITAAIVDEHGRQWEPPESLAFSARVFETSIAVHELSRRLLTADQTRELTTELETLTQRAQRHHPPGRALALLREGLEQGHAHRGPLGADTTRRHSDDLRQKGLGGESMIGGTAGAHPDRTRGLPAEPEPVMGRLGSVLDRSQGLQAWADHLRETNPNQADQPVPHVSAEPTLPAQERGAQPDLDPG